MNELIEKIKEEIQGRIEICSDLVESYVHDERYTDAGLMREFANGLRRSLDIIEYVEGPKE